MNTKPTSADKTTDDNGLADQFNPDIPYHVFPIIQPVTNMFNVPFNHTSIPRDAKWQPEHFPKGTVIAVGYISVLTTGANEAYTVNKVVRNGPDSYVVETTMPWLNNADIKRSFHLSYVTGILTPGKGKVIIDNNHFGINKATWLRAYLSTLVPYHVCFDYDKFHIELEKRFRKVKSCNVYGRFTSLPATKKRIKRWAKQNINRFLMPVALAQTEYDAFMFGEEI